MIPISSKYFISLFLLLLLIPIACAIPVTEYIKETGYWTCPTNVFVAQITVTGGGGGGLGGNATHVGYSGYNASTTFLSDYVLVPGQRYEITIGDGGRFSSGRTTQALYDGPSPSFGGGTVWEPSYGSATTAFGVTALPGRGGTLTMDVLTKGPALNGWNGYSNIIESGAGSAGFGTLNYSYGGLAGVGFGAGGGGGGLGGTGGNGGAGGIGAKGGVSITYDTDSTENMVSGSTVNAITDAALASTTILFTQGQLSFSVTSDGSGLFTVPSSTGLKTGYTITETISKAGYYTETFSFVPYVSRVIPQKISLIPTTFNKYADGTISGIFRDQYGSSISTVSLVMTNTTGGTLSTTSTTAGFYYFDNVPRMSTWNALASKTGYANVSHVFEMGYY